MKKAIIIITILLTATVAAANLIVYHGSQMTVYSGSEFTVYYNAPESSGIDYDAAWSVYTTPWGENYTENWQ
jgi:hypothetical protein